MVGTSRRAGQFNLSFRLCGHRTDAIIEKISSILPSRSSNGQFEDLCSELISEQNWFHHEEFRPWIKMLLRGAGKWIILMEGDDLFAMRNSKVI
jgi:hypothetical protein